MRTGTSSSDARDLTEIGEASQDSVELLRVGVGGERDGVLDGTMMVRENDGWREL